MSSFYQKSGNQSPSKVFLDRGSPLKYGELHKLIGQFTSYLETTQLKAGDSVVISSKDEAWLAVIFFSLVDNGITAVIADSALTVSEFTTLCTVTKPVGCILDSETSKRCISNQQDFELILEIANTPKRSNLLSKLIKNAPQQDEKTFPGILNSFKPKAPDAANPERNAYIILTSGSTSQPKAVPTTWKAFEAHLNTLTRQFAYDPGSRILNLLPIFHVDGLIQGPAIACYSGATWVRPFAFSIANIEPLLHSIYNKKVTHFVCVPTILALILRLGRDLQDSFETDEFKFIISAAGNLESHLWADFQSTFGVRVINMYGLTETVTGGIFSGPDDASHRVGSIGKPVDCQARILDERDNPTQSGTIGELVLRGDNIFSGYLNAAELNKELFHNGWMRTGDLAYQDEEGFFYIAGRKKNVVISGGENIYPEEVTEVISSHPSVNACFTFGILNSDWGESLVALVVPTSSQDYDENTLIEWCRKRLSSYKVPKLWQQVSELPYGPSGKVQSTEAKKLFTGQKAKSEPSSQNVNIENQVISIAADIFHCEFEALTPNSGIADTPGWDSLAHINLVIEVESALKIKMTTVEIMQIDTLGKLINIATDKSAQHAS